MKKLKLVMSIATMCLAIAVLCFGVLAATSVTYTIQGTISYDVEDVYVDVNTTVYKSAKYLSGTEQNALLESLGNPTNFSSAQTTYELAETGVSYSFSTVNNFTPAKSGLSFNFDLETKTYVIVTNVKNLTNKNAWAVVDSRTSTSTNVTIVDNYQLEISKTADTNGKNIVIVVTPTDVTQPIDSGTFTFNLIFGSNEYVNSTTNTDKMIITDKSDGSKSVKKASANISGVLAIPSSVTSIGSSAFSGCSSFTSITIPSSVTSIGERAFQSCSSLTSITIPSSVTSIGSSAFTGCSSLKTVYITDLSKWCSIPFGSSYANPLHNGANLYLNETLITDLVIPSSVTSIGDYTFYKCISLTSVTFEEGSSVTSIGNSAFSGCNSLTSINIPSSVTSIGNNAFFECSSLTSITIPSSVTSIESLAFHKTPWLANLTADSNGLKIVTSSDNENVKFLFGYTGSLVTITAEMLSGVQVIYSAVFRNNTTLQSITIPSSVTNIGSFAFYKCSSLTSATFEYKTWKAGSTSLDLTSTSTSTNATYLTTTYKSYAWTKS